MLAHTKRIRNRSGVVATEFAITLPIVLLFFFAAFEVCRFSMIVHTVDNAVYEGARRGIIPGATSGQCRNEARRILGALGVRNATVVVTPGTIETETPRVTVDITVPFGQNSFVPLNFFDGMAVRRSLTMTREVER